MILKCLSQEGDRDRVSETREAGGQHKAQGVSPGWLRQSFQEAREACDSIHLSPALRAAGYLYAET